MLTFILSYSVNLVPPHSPPDQELWDYTLNRLFGPHHPTPEAARGSFSFPQVVIHTSVAGVDVCIGPQASYTESLRS